MERKTKQEALDDVANKYPVIPPLGFIYRDTDSIRTEEVAKKIRVMDYGKFDHTKFHDLSEIVNLLRRPRSHFMAGVIHGYSYPIMIRTTSDGFGVIFWSSYGAEKIFFTLIDDEIERRIKRVVMKV